MLGDPKRVDEELRRFQKATQVLSAGYPRLIDEYPSQWVAVYDGKVRAHAATFQLLMTLVDEKKLPRSHTIVRYVGETQRTLIV